jgi:outer membrane protein assembly factor BamB
LDAGTGKPSWSLPLGELVPNMWQFMSSPTASNGVVYVLGGGVGSTLCAVDVDTGTLLWSSDYLSATGGGTVAVSETSAYVSGYLQHYAIDRFSGAPLWRSSGPGSGGGSLTPALFNGKLYTRDRVAPFTRTMDQLTGAGSGPVGAAVGEAKGVNDLTRIAAFGGNRKFELTQGTLYAIDLATNQVVWEFVGDGDLVSVPIMIDQTVFVGSKTGMVFGMDALTGRELWRARAGSVIDWSDEFNGSQPLTGMGAGGGLLVVPAGNVLSVFRLQAK